MKKIAFNNFRRFLEFPTMELGKISIMVGRNNSGKSTMVKALLLVLDYLQNQQHKEFSFTTKSLEDANIVTFGRAKNNKSDTNEISIDFEIEGYFFSIFIFGDNEDTSAKVSKIIIKDSHLNTKFEINYTEEIINIVKSNPKLIERVDALGDLINEFQEIEKEITKKDFEKVSAEGLRVIDHYNSLSQKIDTLNKNLIKEKSNSQNDNLFNISYQINLNIEKKTEDTILEEYISDFIFQNDAQVRILKDYAYELDIATKSLATSKSDIEKKENNHKLDEVNKKISDLNLLDQTIDEKIQELVDIDNYRSDLSKSINNATNAIKDIKIYYLGANPSKQSALFSLRDKENSLAQAIHNFKQSKILKGDPEYLFVKHWMKEFEIGADFEIKFYAGEAYELYIIEKEGEVFKSHLADKGMGSLQAMMLIMNVATLVRRHKNTLKYVTIIVEEPELNLHPEFQGKLTEFFHDVNNKYQINFIIETHSEYLIRKSQNILVKENYTNDEGLNPNPFKLHYFDIDNGPYEMKYQENGKFDRKFGKGFFDYADELEVETYKLNLKKSK